MTRTTVVLLLLLSSCAQASHERCGDGEVLCDDVCVPASSVCCGYGNGAICPANYTCGTNASQPCLRGGGAQCASGSCANVFADGHAACCPAATPHYCDGTDRCYATWDDAYYGRSCLLPMDRVCY